MATAKERWGGFRKTQVAGALVFYHQSPTAKSRLARAILHGVDNHNAYWYGKLAEGIYGPRIVNILLGIQRVEEVQRCQSVKTGHAHHLLLQRRKEGNREGGNERIWRGLETRARSAEKCKELYFETSAFVFLPIGDTDRTSSLPLRRSILTRRHTVVSNTRSNGA